MPFLTQKYSGNMFGTDGAKTHTPTSTSARARHHEREYFRATRPQSHKTTPPHASSRLWALVPSQRQTFLISGFRGGWCGDITRKALCDRHDHPHIATAAARGLGHGRTLASAPARANTAKHQQLGFSLDSDSPSSISRSPSSLSCASATAASAPSKATSPVSRPPPKPARPAAATPALRTTPRLRRA